MFLRTTMTTKAPIWWKAHNVVFYIHKNKFYLFIVKETYKMPLLFRTTNDLQQRFIIFSWNSRRIHQKTQFKQDFQASWLS